MPFAFELSNKLLGDSLLESTLKNCTHHLQSCYENLSVNKFNVASLRNHSRKFALLYVALEELFADKALWHVTPKLHLFQECCEEMESCPSLSWTYRDEDAGGSAMQIAKRKGGTNSVTATSTSLLHRFIANHRLPSL